MRLTFCVYALFAVGIFVGHQVSVQPSILIDSGTDLEITWGPADILPLTDNPDSFYVDVYVYAYDYSGKEWTLQHRENDIDNDGQVTLKKPLLFSGGNLKATCIHVTVGSYKLTNESMNLINTLRSKNKIPFPSSVGIWSGLVFSVESDVGKDDKIAKSLRDMAFTNFCSDWREQMSELIKSDVLESLPACPPTEDRARLPNSGLEEVIYESIFTETNYHRQWISRFHPDAAVCFAQAIVTR